MCVSVRGGVITAGVTISGARVYVRDCVVGSESGRLALVLVGISSCSLCR